MSNNVADREKAQPRRQTRAYNDNDNDNDPPNDSTGRDVSGEMVFNRRLIADERREAQRG